MTDKNWGRLCFVLFWSLMAFIFVGFASIPFTAYLAIFDKNITPLIINFFCVIITPFIRVWAASWFREKAHYLQNREATND